MSANARFCPQCGTPRFGAFRYCQGCRFDFDTGAITEPGPAQTANMFEPATPSASGSSENLNATLAGVSWLAAAAILAYLAFEQWSLGSNLVAAGLGDQGLRAAAAWNGVSALLTAYFGARCLRQPDRGFLTTSVGWAILNVAWGTYQVVNGVDEALFVLTIVASGLAGVLSFAARDAAPASKRVA